MSAAVAQLEQSKQRLDALNTRRARVQAQLELSRQQLDEARREAEATYGTADLGKLKTILAEQESKNTSAMAEFTQAVSQFDTFVTQIETALADPQALASLLATLPEPDAELPLAPMVSKVSMASATSPAQMEEYDFAAEDI